MYRPIRAGFKNRPLIEGWRDMHTLHAPRMAAARVQHGRADHDRCARRGAATPTLLSAAEARQLVVMVEDGGVRRGDVPPEIGRALLGRGLVEDYGERDLWTATDAGWGAHPGALRQLEGAPCRRRRTRWWRPAARRLLGLVGDGPGRRPAAAR